MKKTAKTDFWSAFCALVVLLLLCSPALAGMVGMPHPRQLGFQAPATPMKEWMEHFHYGLLFLITGIAGFVMLLLIYVMVRFNEKANPTPSQTTHNTPLEMIWTGLPVVILLFMVVPSMQMLYFVDRTKDAEMTLKVTGNQWYWSYEYPDHGDISFSSNLVTEETLKKNKDPRPRLLATDNPIVLPVDTNIRLLITASDVLHSWAVPAFGVKLDAEPGRLNETWVRIDKEGVFYGQCSELCGQGHGFMPIEVHAVPKAEFAKWVHEQGGKMPGELVKGAANAAEPAAAPAKAGKKSKKEKEKSGEK